MTTLELSSGSVALLGLAAFVLLGAVIVAGIYNGLVNLRNLCRESFSGIDTELQRRHDLIPNLVATVKGYATHERELLERLAQSRAAAVQALAARPRTGTTEAESLRDVQKREQEVGTLLGNVVAVAERYPELKADQTFSQLMHEMRNTEDRIQAARRFFNANIRDYNNRCEQFPSSMVAKLFRFEPREYWELENPLARAPITT